MQIGHSAVFSSISTVGSCQWSTSSPNFSKSDARNSLKPACPRSACSRAKSNTLRPPAVTPVTSAPKCTMTRATFNHLSSCKPLSSARASIASPMPGSNRTSSKRRRQLGLPTELPIGPLLTDNPIQTASFRARSGKLFERLTCQSAAQAPSAHSNFRRVRPVGQCSNAKMNMSPVQLGSCLAVGGKLVGAPGGGGGGGFPDNGTAAG
mmetsp:Transcript_86399/g.247931  ORF Transcript_86399/g.247931 Transcript_86399/m.247931 type:complete len:208 (-) Transcript_86399:181-804(-)